MSDNLQELEREYQPALEHYLSGAGEAALERAYEIGRRAMAAGLGVLQMAALHQRALSLVLAKAAEPEQSAELAVRATDFLAESLSPFEMALRGFQETSISLRSSLDKLAAAHRALEARTLQQSAVAELGQQALEGADLSELLQKSAGLVAQTLDIELAEILELLPDEKTLLLRAGVGWKEGLVGHATRWVGVESHAGFTLLSNEPAILENLEKDTRFHGLSLLHDHGVVSGMSVVIHGREKPFGTLGAYSTKPRKFTKDDIAFLQATANVLAAAIERKRAEEERQLLARAQAARAKAEEAERRFAFLAEASTVLTESLDYEAMLKSVARVAVPFLADWCLAHVIKDNGQAACVAAAHVDPAKLELARELGRRYPPDPNLPFGIPKVLRTGKAEIYPSDPEPLLRAASYDSEQLQILKQLGLVSAMIVPLGARGRTLGAITLVSAQPARCYTRSDLALAEDLARRVALAVDNAALHQEVLAERDKAERANRAKDEFLAILSHELRNPLVPIIGWARVLKSHSLIAQDDTLLEGIRALERNALNMVRLVDDCLDLVRISQQKIEMKLELVDLNEIARASIETMREQIQVKGINLVVDLSPAKLSVSGDRTRLEQVVINLLINSMKYTSNGGSIVIGSSKVGNDVELWVRDTGIGIAPEYLEQIFEPFRQGTGAWLVSQSGLGIGLAISRQIAQMHGGRIWAESEGLGRGSTFRLRLPLAQESHEEVDRTRPELSNLGRPLRILLMEDSEDILYIMKLELERMGYSVLTASDGREGIELAMREKPDLIISDIKMPGLDGYELIKRVRAIPALATVPAIALTGFGMKTDVEKALACGYNAHLSKPVDPDKLSALIKRLASKQKEMAS